MSRKSQGFTEVLYVRAPVDLIVLLDREVTRRREADPGRNLSRSDVVREILYRELGKRE